MDTTQVKSPKIRRVTLNFLVIFSGSGTPRVYSFSDPYDCIANFMEFRADSRCFPYTFAKSIYVTEGHPLFGIGEDVELGTMEIKLR